MDIVLKTVFVKRLGEASPYVYSVAVEDLAPIMVKEVLLGHVLGLLLGIEAGDALKTVIYGPTGEFEARVLNLIEILPHRNARPGNKNTVKGPRIGRARLGGGPGCPFPKGQNSHTPEIFRRGPDHIARESLRLLFGQVLLDEREAIYRGLVKIARGYAGLGHLLALVREMGDRLEGRPAQVTQVSSMRTTIFEKGPGAPGRPPEDGGKHVTLEQTVTRAPMNSPLAGAEVDRL